MKSVSKVNRKDVILAKGKSAGRDRVPSPEQARLMSAHPASATEIALEPDPRAGSSVDLALADRSRLSRAVVLAGRVALMLAGIAVMALGIDLIVHSYVGNAPISACPYVASLAPSGLSFGTLLMGWQVVLVVAQVLILRSRFKLVALLQIPVSLFFGMCVDAWAVPLGPLAPASPWGAYALLAVGIVLVAVGVACTVISDTVMNCGEAVVKAVVDVTGWRFGTVKVGFDLVLTALAALLALALFGHLEGVREGTLACALCTGLVVNLIMGAYGRARGAWRDRREACGVPAAAE
ncbi:MAG: hypothetical protein HFJ75_01490 [Eggerthellaceae bacterium]|nr:hypothetical protein [Eggerthellaceae bacterium]